MQKSNEDVNEERYTGQGGILKRKILGETLADFLSRLQRHFVEILNFQLHGGILPSEHLFQCGTALAKSMKYREDDELAAQLTRLYMFSKSKPNNEDQQAITSFNIRKLQFLVAYTNIDFSTSWSTREDMRIFQQGLTEACYPDLASSEGKYASTFSQPVMYAYLQLLAELWVLLGDVRAYEMLRQYIENILDKQPYHQICKNHCLPGFLAILSPQYYEIAQDILLQHFFRNSYLRSVLKKDFWRLWEQIGLFLSVSPDATVFNFSSALLVKHIEHFSHAARFSSFETVSQEVIQLVNILPYYLVFPKDLSLAADSGSIHYCLSTETVRKAVQGNILPAESESRRFAMATYIPGQIQPEALFVSPDENWSKKYRSRSPVTSAAFTRGAAAVLTSDPAPKEIEDRQFVACRNTFTAMLKLAIKNRSYYKGKVIGITGSVGKTSTAAMLHDVLASAGKPYRNISMFNHETGVPKSIINIPQQTDYAILEMGMGRPLSILPKTMLARPHIVVVTEIQHDHMEFHDSIDSVINTKMEIVEGLEPGGMVILNRDSVHFPQMLGSAQVKGASNILTFGEHPLADIRAKSIVLFPDFSEVQVDLAGKLHKYRLALPGKHMALNSLAVCAVVYALALDAGKILELFGALHPESGRNEIFEAVLEDGSEIRVINDSFNANPASMRSSFHILSLVEPQNSGRRIMVLGDMGELGDKSREYHESLAGDINHSNIDMVYSVGHFTSFLDRKISDAISHQHFSSIDELSASLFNALQHGDVVSFKGSARNNDLTAIIGFLQSSRPRQILSG